MRIDLHILGEGYSKTVDLAELPAEDERVVLDGKDYRVYSRTWYIFNTNLPTTEGEIRITLVPL